MRLAASRVCSHHAPVGTRTLPLSAFLTSQIARSHFPFEYLFSLFFRLSSRVVQQVSQIDAGRLDGELTSLLREQFMRVFSRLHPGAVAHLQPELTFVLDLLVFYFTVWSCRSTPGARLGHVASRTQR
mmetsp:Transcript_11079/g.17803  ORF Transcript_11079/g.17803 Transcript_11079/m.17803 type:complete len:128 (+) Transcript_11079:131-514(+)